MGHRIRNVVLCVDDSSGCEQAVEWACEHCITPMVVSHADDTIQVHLIHVIPRVDVSSTMASMMVSGSSGGEDAIAAAEGVMERRAMSYIGEYFPDTERVETILHVLRYEIDNESIGEIICRKSDELQADVVVMARHGQSALHRFFLGSVTDYCLKHCTRPLAIYNS